MILFISDLLIPLEGTCPWPALKKFHSLFQNVSDGKPQMDYGHVVNILCPQDSQALPYREQAGTGLCRGQTLTQHAVLQPPRRKHGHSSIPCCSVGMHRVQEPPLGGHHTTSQLQSSWLTIQDKETGNGRRTLLLFPMPKKVGCSQSLGVREAQ
jgi:hypothetical protein